MSSQTDNDGMDDRTDFITNMNVQMENQVNQQQTQNDMIDENDYEIEAINHDDIANQEYNLNNFNNDALRTMLLKPQNWDSIQEYAIAQHE